MAGNNKDFSDTTGIDLSAMSLATGAQDKRSACLIVIAGNETGRMYKLMVPEMIIGRAGGGAAVEVSDHGVSRRHAKLVRNKDGSVTLTDLGSTNGTFVNGSRVGNLTLNDGDKLQIGSTTILKFSIQDRLEEDFMLRQYESATRDELTHCHNKKYFLERFPGDFAFARRHDNTLAIAMIDIDHFKKINDTHGHLAGDQVLRTLGRILAEAVRADDVLARYGGEEFVLLMRNTTAADAFTAADRLRSRVRDTAFDHEGTIMHVTLSIGIALCTRAGPDKPDALLKTADDLLYRAKHNGRDRVEVEKP